MKIKIILAVFVVAALIIAGCSNKPSASSGGIGADSDGTMSPSQKTNPTGVAKSPVSGNDLNVSSDITENGANDLPESTPDSG